MKPSKNIYVVTTDKPSQLYHYIERVDKLFLDLKRERIPVSTVQHKNIYITSDEKIKEGDWCIVKPFNCDKFAKLIRFKKENGTLYNLACSKIILTSDQDLIKDGIQAIDDKFLEWFLKNPNCEFVEIDIQRIFGRSSPLDKLGQTFITYKITGYGK